jgi:thiosulfate/3-mercaptopyruvate sulfurtransferase
LEYVKTLAIGLAIVLMAAVAADLAVVQPQDLAAQLKAAGARPTVLYVGPNVLYRSKHIPGAIFSGPGNRPEGLELLKANVKFLPKDRDIVLYCGCCPWDHCPNIKPASDLLRQMGYSRVKVMYSPVSFKSDWIDRGYPVE